MASDLDEWSRARNTGGVILTDTERSTRRISRPIASFLTTNPTRTDLGSKLCLRNKRPDTNV